MKMRRILLVALAVVMLGTGTVVGIGSVLSWPAQRLVGPPPADLGGRRVRITVAGAANVSGWFVRGRPNAGAVLLLHGVRSDRRQMLGRMRLLNSAGYSVLAIDLPAHGESTGNRITFGANESKGVAAALAYLRQEQPRERIGVIGVSLGAASLLLAHPRPAVDAVVLESMYPTITDAVEDRLAIRLGAPGRWLSPLLLSQLKWRAGVSPQQLRPIAEIGQLHAPVLIASGTADRHTTPTETEALFAAAHEPKTLWLVQGAAHVDLYDFAPSVYKAKILPFLERYLQAARPSAKQSPPLGPNNSFKPTQLRGGNMLRLGRSYLPPLRRSA